MNNLDYLDEDPSISNYLRLSQLKNLSGNLRGKEDRKFAQIQNPTLAGASMPPPPLPMAPPEPGNFDVRANLKIEPPPSMQGPAAQDSGIWSKISNGLKSIMPGPNANQQASIDRNALSPQQIQTLKTTGSIGETPNQQTEQLAPNNLTQKPQAGLFDSIGTGLKNLLSPAGSIAEENARMAQQNPTPNQQAAIERNALSPDQIQTLKTTGSIAPQEATQQNQPPSQESEPGTTVQPGAAAQVMSQPSLKAKIDEALGPIDPQLAQYAQSYENAMNAYANNLDDVTARLTEQEKQIKQRIESKNLSGQDKLLMAVALLAPALIGGLINGSEGALGALGGGAKGIADVINQRSTEARSNEDKLSELSLEKAKLGKEKAGTFAMTQEFKNKLSESIPNKELRKIFDRDGQVKDGKLVINSGNPNLPIKAESIRDVEDYKRLKAEAPKLAGTVATLDKAESLIDNMHELADIAIQTKNNKNILQKGASAIIPFNLYDYATGALKAFVPATRDTIKDENGNEYKIAELMSTYRTQLADAWRDAHGKNSNAFKATEQHFNKQLPDPNSWDSFLYGQSDPNQFKKQLDLVKDNFEEAINYIDQQGFDTTDLKSRYGNTRRNKEIVSKGNDKKLANDLADQVIRGK